MDRGLVIVDEAGMVGTDDLRRLLTATTVAGVKTVLVGDQHQIAPVKARGGMFAQLCADLPWTQKLSEVWRMSDPEERSASLALRNGGPAPVRRAIEWYRKNDRLCTGDEVAMATQALEAYRRDIVAGKDSLLVCDTKEMADALNQRIHNDTIDPNAPAVTAARGHQISIGDLIISRRNDPIISVVHATETTQHADPVRNGNRWYVYAVDPDRQRIAARRVNDGACTVFTGAYLRDHITHGYALTVHSAQGATTGTAHAVLSENATRALLYVAMSRGCQTNTVYLIRQPDRDDRDSRDLHRHTGPGSLHAAQLVRSIIGNEREHARTAHDVAHEAGDNSTVSVHVSELLGQRRRRTAQRRAAHSDWQHAPTVIATEFGRDMSRGRYSLAPLSPPIRARSDVVAAPNTREARK